MKIFIRSLVLLISTLLLAEAALGLPTPPAGKQWVAVSELTDEFDSWDSSKWWKPLWNYGVPVQMLGGNSGVTDGKLWIKATLDSGSARWFETSRVMSYEQIRFPMYTECSMKTAHISAYNTFWLNNGDANNRDEFDICENNSKPSYTSQTERPYTMYSQYFIVKNGVTEREHGNFDNRNLSVSNPLRGVKWNEAYHTLGAWWIDKNNIQFYLNGEPAGSVTTIQDFTLDQNIIWDLWTIDATWSGGIANQADLLDDSINTMYVDWIHTYKLEDIPYTGAPVIASVEVSGSDIVMHVTNGPPSGLFDLVSSTNLADPVESWTASQAGLQFDGAGEAMVTNPASENAAFFRIGDTSVSSATFDWAEASGASWWTTAGYTETENGLTMVASGRAYTQNSGGSGVGMKPSYPQDAAPAAFIIETGGSATQFSVLSVDLSANNGSGVTPAITVVQPTLKGMLGGVEQWSISPAVGIGFQSYTTATTGDMSLQVDQLVWNGPYDSTDDNGNVIYDNRIDNLSVIVVSP